MTDIIELPPRSDTLRYRVQVRKALPQDEVRITVGVRALIQTRDTDQPALERRIREALNAFLPAEWMLSRIERGGDAVGYERVELAAIARVKASENYNLAERARQASREGLSLATPRVDYALSIEKVDRIVEELRYDIVRQVQGHIERFDKETGRTWRLGDIAYGAEHQASLSSQRTTKGAYRETEDMLAQIDTEYDAGALAGAERVTLIATVTLKADGPER
jgi:hypothetical protein